MTEINSLQRVLLHSNYTYKALATSCNALSFYMVRPLGNDIIKKIYQDQSTVLSVSLKMLDCGPCDRR